MRIAQLVGVDNIVETARQAGITTHLEPNLSLALGSSAVTPFDMAGAYATFARMGVAIQPQLLRNIQNNKGQITQVFEAKVDRVFPVEPVAKLVDIMQDVVKYGTGTMAKLPDRPMAGKTGTADAAKDIWFVGYTPDMCTAIWGGNDENLPIPGQHVTGGDVMARIWKDYAKAYYDAHPTPATAFAMPSPQSKDEQGREKNIEKKEDGQLARSNDDKTNASSVVPLNDNSGPIQLKDITGASVELQKQTPLEDRTKTAEEAKPAPDILGAPSSANAALTSSNPLLPVTVPAATLPTPVYAPAPSPAPSPRPRIPASPPNTTIMMRLSPSNSDVPDSPSNSQDSTTAVKQTPHSSARRPRLASTRSPKPANSARPIRIRVRARLRHDAKYFFCDFCCPG